MSYNYGGGGGGSQSLSQVLTVGNDAGAQNITNVIAYRLSNNSSIGEDTDAGLNFSDGFGQVLNWNSDNYGLYTSGQYSLTGFGSIYDYNFVAAFNITNRLLSDQSQSASVDFQNRVLLDTNGGTQMLLWGGGINMPQLPTSDPGNPGQLYQLAGVVHVSI